MSLIFTRFPDGGSKFICMLSMADWSDDDGGNLYPSVTALAAKMRVSRSQAQRVLHGLLPVDEAAEEAGHWWVKVVGNKQGGAPGTTRRYQINVDRLRSLPKVFSGRSTGRMGATGRVGATGRMGAQDGSHGCGETGRMGAALSIIEPSGNRHKIAPPRGELLKVLDPERADAVVDHRRCIRKPLTAHAAKLLAGKFAECPDPNAAADAMISNGWQGFEPEWMERRQGTAIALPTTRGRSVVDAAKDMLRELDDDTIEHRH